MPSPDGPLTINERQLGIPTVLVAEEDVHRREILVGGLQKDGYLVLEACDGISALEIARVHSRPIHIMITGADLDSRALAATVKNFRPQMQVVFVPERDSIDPDQILVRVRYELEPASRKDLRQAAAGSVA